MLVWNHVPFSLWSSFVSDTYKEYLLNKVESLTHSWKEPDIWDILDLLRNVSNRPHEHSNVNECSNVNANCFVAMQKKCSWRQAMKEWLLSTYQWQKFPKEKRWEKSRRGGPMVLKEKILTEGSKYCRVGSLAMGPQVLQCCLYPRCWSQTKSYKASKPHYGLGKCEHLPFFTQQ